MAGDLGKAAAIGPPAQSVDQQIESGDGPQDGEGGTQQQRSAALDVASARPRGRTALHPKHNRGVGEKPLQARKPQGKSRGRKTTDPKEPARPQPSESLNEPVAAGPCSGECF